MSKQVVKPVESCGNGAELGVGEQLQDEQQRCQLYDSDDKTGVVARGTPDDLAAMRFEIVPTQGAVQHAEAQSRDRQQRVLRCA